MRKSSAPPRQFLNRRGAFLLLLFALLVAAWLVFEWAGRIVFPPVPGPESPEEREERRRASRFLGLKTEVLWCRMETLKVLGDTDQNDFPSGVERLFREKVSRPAPEGGPRYVLFSTDRRLWERGNPEAAPWLVLFDPDAESEFGSRQFDGDWGVLLTNAVPEPETLAAWHRNGYVGCALKGVDDPDDGQEYFWRTRPSDAERATAAAAKKWRETLTASGDLLSEDPATAAAQRNAAANELLSLPELPEGVVADLARMFWSPGEDEVWRDYCLQFLGSALERTDGVTDADRALARETLAMALSSTNATFAGTALRALHRGAPADPLVASNALRIARDPSYPSPSRTAALLILEDCARSTSSTSSTSLTPSTSSTPSTLAETATAVSADPSASPVLRQTADAVLKRLAADTPNP